MCRGRVGCRTCHNAGGHAHQKTGLVDAGLPRQAVEELLACPLALAFASALVLCVRCDVE